MSLLSVCCYLRYFSSLHCTLPCFGLGFSVKNFNIKSEKTGGSWLVSLWLEFLSCSLPQYYAGLATVCVVEQKPWALPAFSL